MSHRPLVVLSLEGLAISSLGCYGSSWNQTPTIDRIAAGGCVWDRWIAAADAPAAILQQTADEADWADGWRQRGSVELVTDVAEALQGIEDRCFDRIETLPCDRATAAETPVAEVAESQLGQLIAAAIERASQQSPWSVLWLHSGFLTRRWDAPRELLPIDHADEQPQPPSEEPELLDVGLDLDASLEPLPWIFDAVIPPCIELDEQTHPDLVTSWMRTYGSQIRLVDLLVDVLLQSLQTTDPYFVLVGASGFRLGQGGNIGHQPSSLRTPDIQLPMIINAGGPLRIPGPTSTIALPNVLRDLCDQQGEPLISPARWSSLGSQPTRHESRIVTQSSRATYAVTTPGWFFVRDSDSSEHLFLKPDDVEDFNDVGRLRTDVVEQLSGDGAKENPTD